MNRLADKVVMITGAAGGMGESHAKRFIEEGAKVVLTDVASEKGKELAKELGENAVFLKHDVTNADDWENVVTKAEETFGPVNILVNNAGISAPGLIEDLSEDDFRKVVSINQVSVFLGMKYVAPSMKKGTTGSIINISSKNGIVGVPGYVAYDGTKFAVRGMTKTAALELAKFNIRVNSVHPGVIDTPLLAEVSEEMMKELLNDIPLGRLAEPEEVTNLVLFLASDESSYSTGSEFIIDGGIVAK